MNGKAKAISWSCFACLAFGVQNYFIGLTNVVGGDAWAVIGLIWMSSGFSGVFSAFKCYQKYGSLFFTQADEMRLSTGYTSFPVEKFSTKLKLISLWGGVVVGLAQCFMKFAFSSDPSAVGPLCSVICADVILVSVYCHFVYSERLILSQWVAVGCVFAGLVTMVSGDGAGSEQGNIMVGFCWAVVAMLSFGSSVICIRIGAIEDMAVLSGFVVRMLTMGALGVLCVLFSIFTGRFAATMLPLQETWLVWLLPIAAGVSQAAGVYAVNTALLYPLTGVSIAIFGSNSVVVLILGIIFSHVVPGPMKFIGMVITVLGCTLISVLGDNSEADPNCPSPVNQASAIFAARRSVDELRLSLI